jgi:dynein intermediate chain 2, axonemal
MEISYDYIKKRKEFGKHPSFDDMAAFVMESVPSIPGLDSQWAVRQTTSTQLSCIPQMTENSVNTERFVQKDQIMFHSEGQQIITKKSIKVKGI